MNKNKTTGTGGFTLLEVLVALSIMAMAITVILQLFSVNLRAVSAAGHMTSACIKAEEKMKGIIAQPVLEEKSWSEMTADGYRWDIHISEVIKERAENLPDKLMEVILTIHWMEGQKEKSFSLKSQKMIDKMAQSGSNSGV